MLKNTVLKRQIESILSKGSPTQFRIELIVSNKAGTLKITPYDLDYFRIDHDYHNDYTGKCHAAWMISPADYAKIYDTRTELKVTVRHTYLDATGKAVHDPSPVVKRYQGIMVQPIDIRKSTPNVDLLTTPDRQITLALIEETAYKLRFQGIQGTWVKTTIEESMVAILNSWNIKKIHLSPSQNPHRYDHIVVPPYKYASDVFGYLQMKYGVYMHGLASYFYDDYFWIFPAHDTTTEYTHPTTLKIFKDEEGAYAGLTCFHKKDNTSSTSIVTTQCSLVEDRSQLSSENRGTGLMFLRSSQAIDGMVSQDNGMLTFNDQTSVILSVKNNNLADPSNQHVRYARQTDNVHQLATQLSEEQNIKTTIVWNHADPFTVEPGQKIVFYSDHGGKIGRREGILIAAEFKQVRPGTKGGRVGGKVIFQTMGFLTVLLSAEEQVSQTVN